MHIPTIDSLIRSYGESYDGQELASWTAKVNAVLDGKLPQSRAEAILAACAAEGDAREMVVDQSWASLAPEIYARFIDSNGDRRSVAALQLESMAAVADGDVGAGF